MARIGTDIVHIPSFAKRLESEGFVKRVFQEPELKQFDPAHLAGKFAAKEAFFKAIGKKIDWLSVEVSKDESGRPMIASSEHDNLKADVSISHDHDYAIAFVIIEKDAK